MGPAQFRGGRGNRLHFLKGRAVQSHCKGVWTKGGVIYWVPCLIIHHNPLFNFLLGGFRNFYNHCLNTYLKKFCDWRWEVNSFKQPLLMNPSFRKYKSIYDHVNTLPGPTQASEVWKGVVQVRNPEAQLHEHQCLTVFRLWHPLLIRPRLIVSLSLLPHV